MLILQTPGQAPASGALDSVVASPAAADKGGMLPMSDATLSQPSGVSRPEDDPLRMAGGNSQPVCSCISLSEYALFRGPTVFYLSAASPHCTWNALYSISLLPSLKSYAT